MILTGWRLIAAIALSLLLAIALVTLLWSMVIVPILVFGALGIFANAGPILLLAAAGARRIGLRMDSARLLKTWQFCAVLWIGCACGLSHWGDAGQTIGARNLPYLMVLFASYLCLPGQPVF